jgi:hypothetical protein
MTKPVATETQAISPALILFAPPVALSYDYIKDFLSRSLKNEHLNQHAIPFWN